MVHNGLHVDSISSGFFFRFHVFMGLIFIFASILPFINIKTAGGNSLESSVPTLTLKRFDLLIPLMYDPCKKLGGSWSSCSASCDWGLKTRSRSCTSACHNIDSNNSNHSLNDDENCRNQKCRK